VNIQVGSGTQRLPGFLNVDIRQVEGVDIVGHAGDLHAIPDGAVRCLFNSAFLEHLFAFQQLPALREWRRVLARDGRAIILGVPDFAEIARCYLARAPGIVGERFDLYNVYRYSHGLPEGGCAGFAWSAWRPDQQPDAAPAGWLPQLHKALFDAVVLYELLETAGFEAQCFNYCFPGEPHPLNLGAIAGPRGGGAVPRTAEAIAAALAAIATVERFVDVATLRITPRPAAGDLMTVYIRQNDAGG